MTTAILILETPDVGPSNRVLGCIEVTQGNKRRSLPLTSVQIAARVADRLAHVTIKETFKNPYSDHLEAVYIFPLAGGSAVSSFKMMVGERTIVGRVDERQAARDQYVDALQSGKRAALMEQERDDVFTVQVGNLPPGEEVTVEITYSEKLGYFDNGTTELRLPLVVAPRYIPGHALSRINLGDGVELDTDIVPDASRISPPRLALGVDPKTALSLTVELAGDQVIEDLSCSQHATKLGTSKDGFKVTLAREDELLDRDFVLRWRVATDTLQSNFLVYRNPENKSECYGMISLLPPKSDGVGTIARDVIFVVDRSGSMNGTKMASAARACAMLINTLGPQDRFAVQAFDNVAEWMNQFGNRFVHSDEGGKQQGERYLRGITARGGTEMHNSLQEAIVTMKSRGEPQKRLPIIVVLTDGEVGNESPILKHVQSELGDIRVFAIGIDTAVNDGFLNRLAALGGGTASFVQPGAQLEDALSGIGREIGTPIVTNLTLEDINCGLDASSIAPCRIPDLFEGRASNAFFKFSASKLKELANAKLKVKGRLTDGGKFVQEVRAKVIDNPALAQLWAKSYVVDLEDQYRISNTHAQSALHAQIVNVAMAHSLLTKFTAFVVVDEAEIVNSSGAMRTVVQPVQMPAQWTNEQSTATGANLPLRQTSRLMGQLVRQRIHVPQEQQDTGSWGSATGASWGEGSGGSPPGGGGWGGGSYGSAPSPQAPAPRAKQEKSQDGWAQPAAFDSSSAPEPMAAPTPMGAPPPMQAPDAQNAPCAPASPAAGQSLSQWAKECADKVQALPEMLKKKAKDQSSTNKTLLNSFKELVTELNEVFGEIKNGKDGKQLDVKKLADLRLRLLNELSHSDIADRLPLLQRYLRADLVNLIHSIEATKVASSSLRKMVSEQESVFKKVVEESSAIEASSRPFWQANV
ncbi:MAG: VWA domain-containing protein [Cyanobacteria bacterium SZAS-4]|nr:VWA domain-containing protein [Cyanobacteria bacterium SZAS-4]